MAMHGSRVGCCPSCRDRNGILTRLSWLGLGALITTFGVGELSAINAIAGSYAERTPVVHIVGTPPRQLQDSRALVHHTFNDGVFDRFDRMQEPITAAQVMIRDYRTAPSEIDYVLQQCLLHSRPVRIAIPHDMVGVRVSAAPLALRISVPLPDPQPQAEKEATELVFDRIYNSERPMILVDGESKSYGILAEIDHLVKVTGWPTFTSGFGKSLVDETLPNVHGVYVPAYKSFVDSCDLVLCFGPHYSSTNTHLNTTIPKKDVEIDITATSVKTEKGVFYDLPAKQFIRRIIAQLDASKLPKHTPEIISPTNLSPVTRSDRVTQKSGFWPRLSQFFREGDIILAETGTAGYGSNEFTLPKHTHLMKPVTWLSIGFMLPAALGASIAQRDLISKSEYHNLSQARTVLLIGDGSFQLTAQELSTIIHHKLDVVVFLINNDGYTIERCIHGRNAGYNDITSWRYLKAPALFGAPEEGEYAAHTWEIRNWGDLESVLGDENMLHAKGIRMVEVFMPRLDGPKMLMDVLEDQEKREEEEAKAGGA